MNQATTIDKSLIEGYLDNLGGTVVAQMIALYKKQSGVYLTEIEVAIDEHSQSNWQERCHKMKGAAASVGLLSVYQYLVSIEKSTDTWSQKSEHYTRLISLNNAALTEFEQWLESL